MLGIHVTKWISSLSSLLFLHVAPHQVEYLNLYLIEFVQINRRVREKLSSFWWCKRYSAIWSNSREHSKNVFAVNLGYRDNAHEFWRKTFSEVHENQTRLQNSAYTTQKELEFPCTLHFIWTKPSGINRDILKNPIWCGAIYRNKRRALSHLVRWIRHTVLYLFIYICFIYLLFIYLFINLFCLVFCFVLFLFVSFSFWSFESIMHYGTYLEKSSSPGRCSGKGRKCYVALQTTLLSYETWFLFTLVCLLCFQEQLYNMFKTHLGSYRFCGT